MFRLRFHLRNSTTGHNQITMFLTVQADLFYLGLGGCPGGKGEIPLGIPGIYEAEYKSNFANVISLR